MAARLIVNGGFQDLSGAPLALGTLKFQLVQDIANSNVQVGAGIISTMSLDANGNVTGVNTLWSPATYVIKAFSSAGQLVWKSTIDLPDDPSAYSLTPGELVNALLQEDGSFFLLEDGSGIILLEA